ncbi:MAG: hypothetical protein HY721_26355 [Planctomycetes bacterium]|nr:hypothetical protein [Planctomycetota bacterium]
MRRGLWLTVGLMAAGAPLGAADFVRGDANSDGVLSVSDAPYLLGYIFLGYRPLECDAAADANDDGVLDLTDSVFGLVAQFRGGSPPPAPFPGAGPDPTPDDLPCPSYGSGSPLEDPAAALIVRDAAAPGGASRRVAIPIALSSTGSLKAFSGVIHDPSGVLEDVPGSLHDKTPERVGTAGWRSAVTQAGRATFAFVVSFTLPVEIPAGQGVVVAEVVTCLKPGTRAGQYPLTLEAGELTSGFEPRTGPDNGREYGRAIHPTLVSGTLFVEQDVTGSACDTSEPQPPPPIHIRFALEDRTGIPGGEVTIPFKVRADRASQGFSYSVHFDEAILTATDTDKVFVTPSGTPYEFERFEENNEAGYLVGAAVISLSDTGDVLPPSVDVEVLKFDFHISALAPIGETPIEFRDGGRGTGGPVKNKLIAGGQEIAPDQASSFVFVNGLLNIVPDAIPFVRGDSNGDDAVDISDAKFTLSYLFLGGGGPRCADAADANDDGKIDVSDPVATLQFLFTGERKLLPPRTPGLDPTPDGLRCRP